MAKYPTWFHEQGIPMPTPKKKKTTKLTTKAGVVSYGDGQWTQMYMDDIEPAQPDYSHGEWLYKQRQAKGHNIAGAIAPNDLWETLSNFNKNQWQLHALGIAGKWEKWCYENNEYPQYQQWVEMQYGQPLTGFAAYKPRTLRKIPVLNKPGEHIER